MSKNKLIVACAGSGKTTRLVQSALNEKDEKILITTFTEANESEIRKKFIEINGCIPGHVTIQTWFSFLLKHGVKPYQGGMIEKDVKGLLLVNSRSGGIYRGKQFFSFNETTQVEKYYFSESMKIYSDKIAKFVVRADEKSNGAVIYRLSKIYSKIYVDEVQDFAGYDLEFLKLLFSSSISVLLVGDSRQVTYRTHYEDKYAKYNPGLIAEFVRNECKKSGVEIDDTSLNVSYRNNAPICQISSRLYPEYKHSESGNFAVTDHDGLFFVKRDNLAAYMDRYTPMQLRYDVRSKKIHPNFPVMNFSISKGLSFNRIIIYPTSDMLNWVIGTSNQLENKTRAQFYVALTRAKYSVAVAIERDINIEGWSIFNPNN